MASNYKVRYPLLLSSKWELKATPHRCILKLLAIFTRLFLILAKNHNWCSWKVWGDQINHQRTTMLQNASLWIFFFPSAIHYQIIDCKKTRLKISGIKDLGSNWCFLARNAFWDTSSFHKSFIEIILLSNQINLLYFLKYWKVWLAFNGWKLSGLLI